MLSKSCIYGIQAVLYLASQKPGQYVSIREISSTLGISYPFLTKVLQQLTRSGLLKSLRGPHGGVVLTRSPAQITLAEIIAEIDGNGLFEACFLGLPTCDVDQPCPMHDCWAPLRGTLHTTLRTTSVMELAADTEKHRYLDRGNAR